MSDQSNSNIASNEDIVEDLTKELRDAQFTVETPEKASGEAEIDPKEDLQQFEKDFEDSDVESNKVEKQETASDDSDEEALKNQEIDLTDEEKEVKRQEAVALKNQGNEEYKSDNFMESVKTYTRGLQICPLKFSSDRAILYANRAASKIKLERTASAIDDCSKAIQLNNIYVRAYLRRAKLYEQTDKLDESLADYNKLLELDPGNRDALSASQRLPPLINERNEKLKAEMFGKLKDLGNLFLRPFGLSTENFQLQQDPNSGGYSVNFTQNPNT